jgi:CheY-like chemotaxis protein
MTTVPARSQHTILIVEDDVESAGVFRSILEAHGYAVRVATDGEAALVELRERPAAIMIDLHLPTTTGLELLRRIRSGAWPDLPAVVVTGDYLVDEPLVRELDALGARLHFKPLWEEDLVRMVAALISRDAGPIKA